MQYQPLTLCKKHLQDFFKRLRKNTGVKLQYFACGEYGKKFGRPHYHLLVWTDSVLSKNDFELAWSTTLNEQRILVGNIDFVDMNIEAINIQHPMKYVCKYLQKGSFEFEKLPTYKYHYENFNRNFNLLGKGDKIVQIRENWRKYKKMFSPFILCSKRPAIGFEYFERNKNRFQEQDFRIFELPKGSIFPNYFVRKAKESLCPFKTISLRNGKPNSYSTIPQVASMLVALQNCITFNECFLSDSSLARYNLYEDRIEFYCEARSSRISLPRHYFSFYDSSNHFHYRLAPDFMYNVCDSYLNTIYRISIDDFLKELNYSYNRLLNKILVPFSSNSDFLENAKMEEIISDFGTIEKYQEERKAVINNLMNVINERQKNYELTKQIF